jgi:hypothetical protein
MPQVTGGQALAQTLQGAYVRVTSFLGDNGWPLLIILLLGWWLKVQAFDPWRERRRQARILRDAQKRERVEVLDKDLRRVREMQFKNLVGKEK